MRQVIVDKRVLALQGAVALSIELTIPSLYRRPRAARSPESTGTCPLPAQSRGPA